MEIQPVVVGTAGHIDHGKSTLVRALTGIDPDRLKEERERGLTIDLGFANFALPDGRRVGIIDVPGHERFIRNMAAGASGIDLVVLVVAADDGVMPQTREHLAIMELLGVQRGFVALTKIDAVEDELVDLAEEEVREFLAGTFMAEAPILRVSALQGSGLEELRALLMELAGSTPPRSDEGIFRLPIQRVFSVRGFGTVVGGIPVSGSIRVGAAVEVQPGGQRGKVRGIQAYGEATDSARAGHSAALNIADFDHRTLERGHVIATPGFLRPSRLVGARLNALASLERPITNRMAIRLHVGTADPSGEVVLLDVEELRPGAAALVQLRLERPVVVAPGDRFVLRQLSPAITLGGGVVIEESRYRLKRFKAFVVEELGRQETSLDSPEDLLDSILSRAGLAPRSVEELAVELKRGRAETQELLEALGGKGRAKLLGKGGKGSGWTSASAVEGALEALRGALEAWFAERSHRALVDVRELRTRLGWEAPLFGVVLEEAAARGLVELRPGGSVGLAGRQVELDPELAALADRVAAALAEGRFQPPSPAELEQRFGPRVPELLELLEDDGRACRVGGELYLGGEPLAEARRAVVSNCERNGQLEIPELRDELGTTRKFLIPLLEYFDAQGVTIRQAGHRVLKRR